MKYNSSIVAAFVFLFQICSSKFFKLNEEKIVNINYIRLCKGDNLNTFNFHLNINKFNRTHFGVSTNITIPEPFDHTYQLEFEMRLWGDGGWKKNFIHVKRKNACNTLFMLLGPIWSTILEAIHARPGCPLMPGFYYFNDIFFDITQSQLILQPGRFFLWSRSFKNNTGGTCLEEEVEIKQA